MAGVKRRIFTGSDIRALHKELDEVSCPICMDHPHNAVLLRCSSHEKGCRSYICDTSYRHSNCLDRFKRLRENSGDGTRLPSSSDVNLVTTNELHRASESHNLNGRNTSTAARSRPVGVGSTRNSEDMRGSIVEERIQRGEVDVENQSKLKCPVCRGAILGWEVVDEARDYLNLKRRSCSRESCSFSGSYQELRRHARRVHPTTCPSDTDPSRERAWRRLENQTEYGDIVSAIRSAMPGAVVVGDYVIENGDSLSIEGDNNRRGGGNGSLWSTYYLFQMISSSVDGLPERRPPQSRAWTRHRRSAVGSLTDRRFLWGENLLGFQDDRIRNNRDHLHILNDIGEDDESPVPRRRRRLARSRSDADHP